MDDCIYLPRATKKSLYFVLFSRRIGGPGRNWFLPHSHTEDNQSGTSYVQSTASADEQVPEAELSAVVKAVDMLEARAAAQKKNIQVTDLLEDSQGRSPILCFEATDFWPSHQTAHLLKSTDHQSPCPSPPQTSASLMCH